MKRQVKGYLVSKKEIKEITGIYTTVTFLGLGR